jgi:hypothetical protein
MGEHGAPPAHPTAGALARRRTLGLDPADVFAQLREHFGFGPEPGRDREPFYRGSPMTCVSPAG